MMKDNINSTMITVDRDQCQCVVSSVITTLRQQNYLESTIINYRRLYNRLFKFMDDNDINEYSCDVGELFINNAVKNHNSSNSKHIYTCGIRRLNDQIYGVHYRCHRSMKKLPEIPDTFSQPITSFIKYCSEELNNKEWTLDFKRSVCILFSKYLVDIGCDSLSEMTLQSISVVLPKFSNKDKYAIIRQYITFLFEEKLIKWNFGSVIKNVKRTIPVPTTYSIDEIQSIERSINTSTVTGKRDYAILLCASRLGLRSGDIALLRYDEIDFVNEEISIIQNKTKTRLTLKMPHDLSVALKNYMEIRGSYKYDNEYIFHTVSAPYGRITTSIIRRVVNDAFVASGIDTTGKKHGPHSLRSSLASSLINDDIPYESVRRILGHNDPNAIKHYAKVDIERLRRYSLTPPKPRGLYLSILEGVVTL